MKVVLNGIYETKKMLVVIEPSSVIKKFKKQKDYIRRYSREKIALQRLKGFDYFPELLSFDHADTSLKMSRLKGSQPQSLSVEQVVMLRKMVSNMLARGVSRHAMPIRDLLADNDKELGMVDFERTTLRGVKWSPIWWIAKKVSNYHLYRIINTYQPQELTEKEQQSLAKIDNIRTSLVKVKRLKNKIKSFKKVK